MATQNTEYSQELQNLIASLQRNAYVPRTAAQREAAAQARFTQAYDQQRLSAQQAQETHDAALARELNSLQSVYDAQRERSGKEYAQAYSRADRHMLTRGMQRSSYGAQVLANINTEGAEALQDITKAEGVARTGIEEQRTLLAQQLAQQLNQYTAAEQADILGYIDQLEQQDYERGAAQANSANQLAAMIYEYQMAERAQQAALAGGRGGGSRAAQGNGTNAQDTSQPATNTTDPYGALFNSLTNSGGGASNSPEPASPLDHTFRLYQSPNRTRYNMRLETLHKIR